MVFIMFQGALSVTENATPGLDQRQGLENGFHVVRLSSLTKPSTRRPCASRCTTPAVAEDQGYLTDNDVYGVVGAPVSFHDRDAGYSVTQGDYLVISSRPRRKRGRLAASVARRTKQRAVV